MMLEINGEITPCKLTSQGMAKVETYITELEAKRKEILDADKDTAEGTEVPNIQDIISDIEWFFDNDLMEYCNNWGVTDDYNSDYPLCLKFGEDIVTE